MRGAGLRLSLDIRRHWKCAACGAERRLPATVTTVRCQCTGQPQMKLVESQRRGRTIAEPPNPVLEIDLTDEPVSIPENLPIPEPNPRFSRGHGRGHHQQAPPPQGPPPGPDAAAPETAERPGKGRPPRNGGNGNSGGGSERGEGRPGGNEPGAGERGPRGPGRDRSRQERRRPEGSKPAPENPSQVSPAEGDAPVTAGPIAEAAPPAEPAPPLPPKEEDFGAGLDSVGS